MLSKIKGTTNGDGKSARVLLENWQLGNRVEQQKICLDRDKSLKFGLFCIMSLVKCISAEIDPDTQFWGNPI